MFQGETEGVSALGELGKLRERESHQEAYVQTGCLAWSVEWETFEVFEPRRDVISLPLKGDLNADRNLKKMLSRETLDSFQTPAMGPWS